MAAVERDHEVVAREIRVRELLRAVPGAVVAVPVERVDRALIGSFADVQSPVPALVDATGR